MADIGHFAAGILLDAQLDDAHLFAAERDLALDAQDAGALEARGDAAVQVLLARDVELADDVALEQQRHLHGDLHRLAVEQEGGRVVYFVGAGGLVLDAVDHDLAGLELHQRRAVVFAELGEGGPHVADDLGVVILMAVVAAGRAMAKEFLGGQQLLVHFQAALEPHFGVGRSRGLPARGIAELFLALFVILLRLKGFFHYFPRRVRDYYMSDPLACQGYPGSRASPRANGEKALSSAV